MSVTVNDLLVRDLFLELDQWNRSRDERRKLHIAIPVNLRQPHHENMPAANVVSMVFLDRYDSALDDNSRLLDGIVKETMRVKQNQLALTMPRLAHTLGRFPRGIQRLTGPPDCTACRTTAVMSNLGIVQLWSASSSPQLKTIELYPPMRPSTHVSVGACTFDSKLTLALNHHSQAITNEAAQELLTAFALRIQSSSGNDPQITKSQDTALTPQS